MSRDAGEQALGQIAVRVNQSRPPSRYDVVFEERLEKRRLPHAGLPHDGQMPAAVVGEEPAPVATPAEIDLPQDGQLHMRLG